MTTTLSPRQIYEWRITNWFRSIGKCDPDYGDWQRGTLEQLRTALQPYMGDTAEYAWQVRDPKTDESIPHEIIQEFWMDRDC